jgi:translation initiation factor 1
MIKGDEPEYRVVYSTGEGAVCPACRRAKSKCVCAETHKTEIRGDGNVKVRRETAGRGGKTVTTITGLALNHGQLQTLLKELKRVCGAGGSLKDWVLEVQGDHCEAVIRELLKRGIRAKRAGG